MAAGVPCVIATTQAINGEVAKNFAARFYHGLATGASIRTAYDEAVGEATAACHGKTRLLYADEDSSETVDTQHGHWPWFMRTAPGAEAVEDWNLPDAAGDPLALLPLPVTGPLPESPYPGLRRFTAADAAVFFGRGQAIRRLYERVTSATSAPIILLHGQSGVGKSSILEAGLAPRLDAGSGGFGNGTETGTYEVVTVRLDPVRGILDSLRLAFLEDACCGDGTLRKSADAWRLKEQRLQRPLLVILDQVEEAFTHAVGAVPADWDMFVNDLSEIFGDRARAPRGKVILSFRTEWFSRINSRLQGLWKSEVFLDCLDAAGIHEATEGPTRHRKLREHYPLTIEPGLALRIATELLMDAETSVAPTLQILLKKLWDQATLESRTPVFDEQLYRRHRATLGDFVRTQIQNITNHKLLSSAAKHAIEAGLLLDFLECHVTPDLTSRHQSLRILLEGDPQAVPLVVARYPGRGDIIRELRALCIDHYLLVQPDSGTNVEPEPASRLAHDSLATHVHAIYEASDAAGPRARRILEQRATESRQGVHDELEPSSLRAIERGRPGMRAWTPLEENLVRVGRRNRLIRRASLAGIAVLLLVASLWMRLEWFRQEVITAFLLDADQVKTLYDLAEESPWVSTQLAHRYFAEERSLRIDPLMATSATFSVGAQVLATAMHSQNTATAIDGGQLLDGLQALDVRDRRRRGLRAAMVLIHLGRAKNEHVERLLEECLTFDNFAQHGDFRIVRDVLTVGNRWNHVVESSSNTSAFLTEALRRGNPPVVTSLLLAAGHPERIPSDWYRSSADPTVRTRNIVELSRWCGIDELLVMLKSLHADKSSVLDPDSADDLRAVLCLAVAEATPELLLAWLDNHGPASKPELETYYFSTSAVLRSASRLLLERLSLLRRGVFKSPAELDLTVQVPLHASRHKNVVMQRHMQSNWARINIASESDDASETTVLAGLDFVRISAVEDNAEFWISATEVPVSAFHAFLNDRDFAELKADRYIAGMTPFDEERPDHPANYVSWEEALNFCNWLSSRAELKRCYTSEAMTPEFPYIGPGEPPLIVESSDGFRLPQSDQWVRACRAGSMTRFSFDDNFDRQCWENLGRHAWFLLNTGDHMNPCASRLPNSWGLFDMHGSLCEWCCDPDSAVAPGEHVTARAEVRSSDFQTPFSQCTSDEITPVIDGRARDSQLMGFRILIPELPDGQ